MLKLPRIRIRLEKNTLLSILLMGGAFMLVVGISLSLNFFKKGPALSTPSRDVLKAADEHRAAAAGDKLIVEPQDGLEPLTSLIRGATSSIDLVMYELNDPGIEQALADAKGRGVAVRVLLNQGYFGKASIKNAAAYRYLESHQVAVHWTPSAFALTHEKSILVDGKQALIMTFNLEPKYYSKSRDFGVIDVDPADMAAMTATFEADWQGVAKADSPGDDLIWSPNSKDALLSVVKTAKKSLVVYNEEMADQDIIQALGAAARRGVSVEILMAYSSKWKDAFTELTAEGVKIQIYKRKKPLYIHAKAIVADETYVFVGSENFSSNSLLKNRELGLLISNTKIANSLLKVFHSDLSSATTFTALGP
jgi:cardiolipin synthase